MQKISLNGSYQIKMLPHCHPIYEFLNENFYPDGFMRTDVPEDIRTMLKREGLISGHYYGKNLDSERFIEEHNWLYHRFIDIDKALEGKRNFLCFDGIDTLAEIYLNGRLVGKSENMFLSYSFDVSELLRYGAVNTLLIKIISPIKSLEGIDRTGLYPQEDTDRLLIRKSQMNYGWDFCGHCLTNGIWKDVYLQSIEDAKISDVFLHTDKIDGDKASVGFSIETELYGKASAKDYTLDISLARDGNVVADITVSADHASGEIIIPAPLLWWPRPYGEPNLYDVTVNLCNGDNIIDSKKMSLGIRTIKLIQDPLPDGGRSFIFEVNGRRLFIRGANWVPTNCVYSEITRDDYDFYIKRAIDSNLSMLRIWGGGIYEPDYFFDLCDKNGILVFQDFMLACGVLPQTDDYLEKVNHEVEQIVKYYRSRTSLAIWSADNELDQAYWWYDLQAIFKTNRVNRIAVKTAVKKNDPTRPFLVSSPCSPFDNEEGNDDPNSPLQGDMHIYLTRFDSDSEYYYKKLFEFTPRFMSEYGFSSLPNKSTYERFNFFGGKLDLLKNPWLGELKSMSEITAKNSTDEVIEFTQYTHSQALKYWIEYMRSCRPVCGGSLYWKFNDPIAPNRENMLFPTMMSAIDFYRTPKLAYYYARRAYDDVILAFKEDLSGNLSLYSCNETDTPYKGRLTVRLSNYSGKVLHEQQAECHIASDASAELLRLPIEEYKRFDKHECYIRAEFNSDDNSLALVNRFYMVEICEWPYVKLPDTTISARPLSLDGDTAVIEIKTDSFAQDVTALINDTDAYFSDNSFLMDAGESRTITVTCKNGFKEKPIRIKAYNSPCVLLHIK